MKVFGHAGHGGKTLSRELFSPCGRYTFINMVFWAWPAWPPWPAFNFNRLGRGQEILQAWPPWPIFGFSSCITRHLQ